MAVEEPSPKRQDEPCVDAAFYEGTWRNNAEDLIEVRDGNAVSANGSLNMRFLFGSSSVAEWSTEMEHHCTATDIDSDEIFRGRPDRGIIQWDDNDIWTNTADEKI